MIIIIIIIIIIKRMFLKQDGDPTLEYRVGGRLNHTTFVLGLRTSTPAEAVGAVEVTTTSQKSAHPTVGTIHLELTSFFHRRRLIPNVVSIGPVHTVHNGGQYIHIVANCGQYTHIVASGGQYTHIVANGGQYTHIVANGGQ